MRTGHVWIRQAALGCFLSLVVTVTTAHAQLTSDAKGGVVDSATGFTWLADANLAATVVAQAQHGDPQAQQLLSLCGCQSDDQAAVGYISSSGAMDFATAVNWMDALNDANYAGTSNWTLPLTPKGLDRSCSGPRKGGPGGNSFGFNCGLNDLAHLFYTPPPNGLGLIATSSPVQIPATMTAIGPFQNVQPYLYWSGSSGAGGHKSFSLTSGFDGANTDENYLYLLPMIDGKASGPGLSWSACPGSAALECSSDGQLVYDPVAGVTWLQDADLAATQTFGIDDPTSPNYLTCTQQDDTTHFPCINSDGAMTWPTASAFVKLMSRYGGNGWANQKGWTLATDSCEGIGRSGTGCKGSSSPMGDLYSQLGQQLQLPQGTSLVAVPADNPSTSPFTHLQPYLYWSCPSTGCADSADAQATQEFSFSFGNGFQGTDLMTNFLYVTLYAPPAPAPQPAPVRRPPLPVPPCPTVRAGQPPRCV